MKLFENKVGRPSNEILMKRRTFYLVVTALIVALVGTIAFAIGDVNFKSLSGDANVKKLNSQNFKFQMQLVDGTSVGTNVNEVYGYGTYKVLLMVANASGETLYGRWFTYADTNTSKKPSYYDKTCFKIPSSYSSYPTLGFSSDSAKERAGRFKIYLSKTQCENDKTGTYKGNKLYKDGIVTYKVVNKVDVTATKLAGNENSQGVVVLKEGTHQVTYQLKNETGKNMYYRWGMYNSLNKIPGNITGLQACKTFSKTTNVTYSMPLTKASPVRIGVLRVYDNSDACSKDANFTNQPLKEKIVTYTMNTGTVSFTRTGKTAGINNSTNEGIISKTGTFYYDYTLNNTTGQTYYSNFYTYANSDYKTSKVTYGDVSKCRAFSSSVKSSVSLSLNSSSQTRSSIYKIYSSLDACKADKDGRGTNGVVAKDVVIVRLKGWATVNFDNAAISSKIGMQLSKKCWSAAAAYGVYILSNGKKVISSPSSTSYGSYNYGNYKFTGKTLNKNNYYSTLVSEIKAGRPVVIHVTTTGEHWVLAVGYNNNKSTSAMGTGDIYVIDPYKQGGSYGSKNVTLYNGSLSNDPVVKKLRNYSISYWKK